LENILKIYIFNDILKKNNLTPEEFSQSYVQEVSQAGRTLQILSDFRKFTREAEDDLHRLFQSRYGSPSGFHKDCKQRLGEFQERNKLKKSWSDSCLTPILVMDYLNWKDSEDHAMPEVNHMTTYAGI
jgi:hypothetical protein